MDDPKGYKALIMVKTGTAEGVTRREAWQSFLDVAAELGEAAGGAAATITLFEEYEPGKFTLSETIAIGDRRLDDYRREAVEQGAEVK